MAASLFPAFDYEPPKVDTNLRIGVIGAGGIVRDAHLPAYRRSGWNVVGITDLRDEASRELAARFDVPRTFSSALELIESDEVDVVDLAIPEAGRLELIEAIARTGKPFLCQKPLSESLEHARRMVATARAGGSVMAVNQNARWAPEFRAAKTLFETGALGELYYLRWEMRNWADSQGWAKDSWNAECERWQLVYWSIHHLDLIRYWAQEEPTRVYASLPRKPGQNFRGEVMASVVMDFASGKHAVMLDHNASIENCEVVQEFGLEGTEGVVTGRVSAPRQFEVRLHSVTDQVFHPELAGEWYPSGFQGSMGDLLLAIGEGREPQVSGEDHLKTLALVEACYRSARDGVVVDPADVLAGK